MRASSPRHPASNLALLVALLAAPVAARAAPETTARAGLAKEAEARKMFDAAEKRFNLGDFRGALRLYRRAYDLHPAPGLLFNVAQCYRNLGHCHEAVFYYQRYLAMQPDSAYAEDIRRIIARCRRRKTRAAPDVTRATSRPTSRPTSPMAGAGRHAEPGRSSKNTPPADRGPRDQRRRSSRRVLLWSGVALGCSLAVAGTITGALALDRNDRYKDPETLDSDRPQLRSSGQDLALATNVLWGVAAASVVATGLVYWLYRPGADSTTRAAAAIAPRAGGAMVGIGGRF